MRQILFKAKRMDNEEWVEGSYAVIGDKHAIIKKELETYFSSDNNYEKRSGSEVIQILPKTVCQYTELTDKKGKKIFEGDILEFDDVGEEGYEYKEGFDYKNRASVVFLKGRFELGNFMSTNSAVVEDMVCFCHEDFVSVFEENEVIGNIFDNPELLEVK